MKERKPTKNVRVFVDVHRKLKIHVAITGDKIDEFVSNTLEKEIKNAKKKVSGNIT